MSIGLIDDLGVLDSDISVDYAHSSHTGRTFGLEPLHPPMVSAQRVVYLEAERDEMAVTRSDFVKLQGLPIQSDVSMKLLIQRIHHITIVKNTFHCRTGNNLPKQEIYKLPLHVHRVAASNPISGKSMSFHANLLDHLFYHHAPEIK